MTATQKSDGYILRRASQIVGAVQNCGCEHCIKLLEESKAKIADGPSRPTAPVPEPDAVNPKDQLRNDYKQ